MGWLCKEYTTEKIPDLTGKVSVVTGANTGIGYHIALELARNGSRVYVACRNEERAQTAIEKIKEDIKKNCTENKAEPDLRFLALDLNSLAKVDAAAKELIAAESQIHILINNAGIMAMPYSLTEDGIESQFGVNHVGPTLFTHRLLPTILNSGTADDPARIIFTASMGHYYTYSGGVGLTLEAINDKKAFGSMRCYGQSKLANILASSQFARQVSQGTDRPTVLVNAVHPGIVSSDLGRNVEDSHGWIVNQGNKLFYGLFSMSSANGALTSLYAATSDEVKEKGYNGKYFIPYGKLSTPSSYAQDETLQDNLWTFTQSLFNEKLKQNTKQ
ncbi:hypothetical protein BDF19DRAFT_455054 [Syncephalis fuscata]|nr:hypothetical protein BDF19DRAFT_455054 [Syncephalis fuscata]